MEKISDFVAGKQYKLIHDTRIYDCVYVATFQACMIFEGKIVIASLPEKWKEYKETVTITKYTAVIRVLQGAEEGKITMHGISYKSENECRSTMSGYSKYWELIDIIPVTWTGEV